MGATYFRAVRKRYGPQDTADVLEVCGACSRAKAFDAMFVHRPLDVFRAIRPLDNFCFYCTSDMYTLLSSKFIFDLTSS